MMHIWLQECHKKQWCKQCVAPMPIKLGDVQSTITLNLFILFIDLFVSDRKKCVCQDFRSVSIPPTPLLEEENIFVPKFDFH